MASSINASTSGPGGVITTADNSGILQLQSGGTTIATANSTGLTMNTGAILNSSGRPMVNQTGSVLQVVTNSYATNITTTNGTWITTGLSASITPSSTSSKILVLVAQATNSYSSNGYQLGLQLWRNSSSIFTLTAANGDGTNGPNNIVMITPLNYLDSPATTSSVTYTTYFSATATASGPNGNYVGVQASATPSYILLLEIAG